MSVPGLARRGKMAGASRCDRSLCRQRRQRGFTMLEMLVVLAMAAVLMAIGMPALFHVGNKYKVTSSAQQLVMLARQARYQAIERSTQVSVVPDTNNSRFYVIAQSPPPTATAYNGYTDFPAAERVAMWEMPNGVYLTLGTTPIMTYNSDGSGNLNAADTFSWQNLPASPDYPVYTVTIKSAATGKLTVTHSP